MADEAPLTTVALSVDSPHLPTRRLALELLAVFCYVERPLGHSLVIRALDNLQKVQNSRRECEL